MSTPGPVALRVTFAAPPDEVPNAGLPVAVHEAAHAILAVRCGWPIRYVTLNSRTPGSIAHVQLPGYEAETSAWDDLAVSAAGPIAHDIVTGGGDRPFISTGAKNDFELMHGAACVIRDAYRAGARPKRGLSRRSTLQAIAEVGWTAAHRTVVADWGAVLAVADALLGSRRAVTGRDVRLLIERAETAPPPANAGPAGTFWPPWFQPRDWWTPAAAGAAR